MEREIKVGSIYKHFKGHIYKVIAIAYDSENYNDMNPYIKTIKDESIFKGFRIMYRGKMYDYSL